MSADERVTRAALSRRLKPIAVPRALPLLPGRVWSDAEWERISLGYRARDMDQKWNVFTEGDVVHVHRSWTGFGMYEATFTPVEGGGRKITAAVVERDPERYRNDDDAYDCLMLELVLSAIVLGEPADELRQRLVESARARAKDPNVSGGLVQHSVLGLRSDS
ncbi:hypothetical protein [Streptomyces sp. CC228A]|uniref:hypothetical protein n=1 Tax=Streptomyces sp. CC228A TaxID=2898186 RepID=UPI001F245268|nr:hypothetical protein [Streptomyces sp. CC228A]